MTWFSHRAAAGLLLGLCMLAGCHRDMRDQPRFEPLEANPFFANGMSARPVVAGTIARGQLDDDQPFATGKDNGKFLDEIPLKIDRALLERGRERFNISCIPCHDRAGNGNGMIVQRGFPKPPSYHTDRLRDLPVGHLFDVITNGFGAMPRFGPQLPPSDRWAIVAYVRALQLSQSAKLEDVPADERAKLEGGAP